MLDSLVSFLVGILGGINKEVAIFIISLLPVLELRGGLLAATLLHVDFIRAVIICIIGNILPIPFVLLLLERVFNIMKKWRPTEKIVTWLEKKADSKRAQIAKFGYLGLILFVGIPLPGTGAWTGSLVAVVLKLDKKKAFACTLIGILLAAVIMSIVSYGILGSLL